MVHASIHPTEKGTLGFLELPILTFNSSLFGMNTEMPFCCKKKCCKKYKEKGKKRCKKCPEKN